MAVSFSTGMPAPTVPAYMTGRTSHHAHAQHHIHPATNLRLFRPRSDRTMSVIQQGDTAGHILRNNNEPSPSHEPSSHITIDQNNSGQSILGSQASFFDDVFQYHDEHSYAEGTGGKQWQFGQYNTFDSSLKANDSVNGSFSKDGSIDFNGSLGQSDMLGTSDFPYKMTKNLAMPSPPVLPHEVDASMYENVDDAAWVMSSIDYDPQSPSSIDANSNEPHTPASPDSVNFFGRSTSADISFLADGLAGVDAKARGSDHSAVSDARTTLGVSRPSFSSACQCPTCRGAFSRQASLAEIWNAAQPRFPMGSMRVDQQGFNGVQQNALNAETMRAYSPGVSPILPGLDDHQELNRLLLTERAAMDTTPEGSDSSEADDGSNEGDDHISEVDVNDQAVAEAAHRRDRDKFLLKMRAKGLSYKEIKRRGRFSEAESTLRGRVRVLTKDKSERVRKPEWTARDLNLLSHAVDRYSEPDVLDGTRGSHGRIPWKKISTWMKTNGSSYTFAAATCARKWRTMN